MQLSTMVKPAEEGILGMVYDFVSFHCFRSGFYILAIKDEHMASFIR